MTQPLERLERWYRPFDRLEAHHTDDDWVVCWVEVDRFRAACGPQNLDEALGHFLDWAGA